MPNQFLKLLVAMVGSSIKVSGHGALTGGSGE